MQRRTNHPWDLLTYFTDHVSWLYGLIKAFPERAAGLSSSWAFCSDWNGDKEISKYFLTDLEVISGVWAPPGPSFWSFP